VEVWFLRSCACKREERPEGEPLTDSEMVLERKNP
jgi:hypothetical protein